VGISEQSLSVFEKLISKKSPNFTELQKTVLIELVDSRNRIIERKQNDDSAVSPPGDWIGIYVQSIAPTIPGIRKSYHQFSLLISF
jgi:hypothetical protein